MIFFLLLFGVVELARAMYICNTLQEVTRRAAALAVNTDFSDARAMQRVREKAIFRTSPGRLMFADPVSDRHIKIDYLYLPENGTVPVSMGSALPSDPMENRLNCMRNPTSSDCIRLVRIQVCTADSGGDGCKPLRFKTMLSLIPLSFDLPIATTIAKSETFGLAPGTPPCEC